MKSIDSEIAAVEQRIGARKVAVAYNAHVAKQRALKKMTSPAVLGGALLLGFLAAGIGRRRKPRPTPGRRKNDTQKSKGLALGTLAMTGATWFVRSQFGGPVGLAQFVLSRVRDGRSTATGAPADSLPRSNR